MLDRYKFIVKKVETLDFRFSGVLYADRLKSRIMLFSDIYLSILLVLEMVFETFDKRLEVVDFVRLTKVAVVESVYLIFKY